MSHRKSVERNGDEDLAGASAAIAVRVALQRSGTLLTGPSSCAPKKHNTPEEFAQLLSDLQAERISLRIGCAQQMQNPRLQ
jgi:hypothetical protein